jgi:excisionase family DNA binding protein
MNTQPYKHRSDAAVDRRAHTVRQAAQITNVGQNALRNEIAAGRIRVIKIGRRIVIPDWSLEEWLRTAIVAPETVMLDVDWEDASDSE